MKSKTKKSPRKIIECVDRPNLEQAWKKENGKEISQIGLKRTKYYVEYPGHYEKIIHTHPNITKISRYPSPQDIYNFIYSKIQKTAIVAQTNPKNGKLIGYFIFRKTKKTPKPNLGSQFIDALESLVCDNIFNYEGFGFYSKLNSIGRENTEKGYAKKIEDFMVANNLSYRYVPVKNTNN